MRRKNIIKNEWGIFDFEDSSYETEHMVFYTLQGKGGWWNVDKEAKHK